MGLLGQGTAGNMAAAYRVPRLVYNSRACQYYSCSCYTLLSIPCTCLYMGTLFHLQLTFCHLHFSSIMLKSRSSNIYLFQFL